MPGTELSKLWRIARAYLFSVGIWCSLSLLTGWQYRIFDQAPNIHSSLFDMLVLAESRGFAFALLTPPIFYIVHHTAGAGRLVRYLSAYCLGVVPFTLLYACTHWALVPPWDAVRQRYVSRSGHGPLELIYQGFADQITMYIAIVIAAHAYQYFVRVRKQEV
jgi:hypothetical protein